MRTERRALAAGRELICGNVEHRISRQLAVRDPVHDNFPRGRLHALNCILL